jgi:hypothetical protein
MAKKLKAGTPKKRRPNPHGDQAKAFTKLKSNPIVYSTKGKKITGEGTGRKVVKTWKYNGDDRVRVVEVKSDGSGFYMVWVIHRRKGAKRWKYDAHIEWKDATRYAKRIAARL